MKRKILNKRTKNKLTTKTKDQTEMLAKFIILENLAYRYALLSQYKTIAISFERTGQTLNLHLKTSK